MMTTEDMEASQSGVDADEGGMGGPGAPTPLAALEVWIHGLSAEHGCHDIDSQLC